MKKAQQMRIRHCPRCANSCPLDKPRCKTGEELADAGGMYEPVPEKPGFFSRFFKRM